MERQLSSTLEVPASLSPQWNKPGKSLNQFQPGAQEAPKSALIGDGWLDQSPGGQFGSKPVWDAIKPQNKVADKWVGPSQAGNSGNLGGPARWREDERDNPSKWGGQTDAPRVSLGGDRWAAQPAAPDDAGRGRGRPDDRWASTRDKEPWALPGMGEPIDTNAKRPAVAERWGGEGAADPARGAVDRWRPTGAAGAPRSGSPDTAAAGAGRGRGFMVGRGRGMKPGMPAAPGAPAAGDRWEAPSLHRPLFDGRPAQPTLARTHSVVSKRYSAMALERIRQQMIAAAAGGQLPVPSAVISAGIDYPELLPGEPLPEPQYSDLAHKRYQAGAPPRSPPLHVQLPEGSEDEAAGRPLVSPQAFAYNQWVYKDPQGVIQGPFTKVDILDWLAAGFFPSDLPIKSATEPNAPFIALSTMVKMWDKIDHGAAPPGFVPTGGAAAKQQQQQPVQLQQQQPVQAAQQELQQQQQLPREAAVFPEAPQGLQQGGGRVSIMEMLGKKLQDAQINAPGPADGFEPATTPTGHHPIFSPYNPLLAGPEGSNGLFGVSPSPWGMPPAAAAPGASSQAASAWGLAAAPAAAAPAATGWLPPPSTPPPQLQQQQPVEQAGLFGGNPIFSQPPQVPSPHGSGAWADPALAAWLRPPQPDQQPWQQQQQVAHGPGVGVDLTGKLAQPMNGLDAASQHQQVPQPSAWGPAPALGTVQPSTKTLAQIQQEQAADAASKAFAARLQEQPAQQHQQQQAPEPAAAPAAPEVAAPKAKLASLPGPLQQLFAAAQRATQPVMPAPPPQQQQQQPAAEAAAPVAAPASTPADAPARKKGSKAEQQAAKAAQPAVALPPPPPTPAAPVPAPQPAEAAAPKPEVKVAPWAAATAKVPAAKTLREIQEEEAAQAAAEALRQAQEQAALGPVAAPSMGGQASTSAWAKVAAAGAAPSAMAPPPGAWGNSVPAQEQRPKAVPAAATPQPPRGPTLGEILDRQLNPNPAPRAAAWGAAAPAAKAAPVNMREILMFEESAADLEGGDMDEDVSDLLPQQASVQPPRAAAPAPWAGPQAPAKTLKEIQEEEEERERASRQRQQQQQRKAAAAAPPAAAAPREEDMLFWDYGPQGTQNAAPAPAAPPPPPAPARPAGSLTAAAIAAKGIPAAARAPAAPAPKSAWVNAAAAKGAAPSAAASASRPLPAQAARPAAPASAGVSRPAAAEQQQQLRHVDSAPTIMLAGVPLSDEFGGWCRDQLTRLLGTDDLTMVEVLLSLDSRSEVAETCQVYMGNKPGVGAFVAEFLKRKDAELLRQQQGSKKKKGAGAAQNAATFATAGAKGKAR